MKKLFFMLGCMLAFVACTDKNENQNGTNDTNNVSAITIQQNIVGEWVVDYAEDSPEGYSWEIIKFLDSGVMYFSNYSEKKDIRHNYVNGTYEVSDNLIATNCQLGFSDLYQTQNADIKVHSINEYEMVAELVVHDDLTKHIATNHYKKVVASLSIGHEETTPDYQKYCASGKILGYKSHNGYIVNVNEKTGALSGVWAGSTYVDIITDKGTAVLYVSVNTMFDYDYEKIIGLPKESIPKAFKFARIDPNVEGSHIYNDGYYPTIISSEGTWIYIYDSDYCPALQAKSGNWDYMEVVFNKETKNTEAISLVAKDETWFTQYQLEDYLAENYFLYDKQPEEYWDREGAVVKVENTWKAYINTPSLDKSSVGISWNGKEVISFVGIQQRLYFKIGAEEYLPDYKVIIGNETPQGYASENKYVATVDKATGKITGHDSGSTRIKITTEQDVYFLRLQVNAFLTENYESLLGKTQLDMVNFYGVVPFYADGEDWIFKYNSVLFPELKRPVGNWESMLVKMSDRWGGIVTELVLTAKEDVWFNAEEMDQYLTQRYQPYDEDTHESTKVYINNAEYENASVKLSWDMVSKVLTFQTIYHEGLPVYDYGRYIGKTHDEAIEMMKSEYNASPSTDDGTTLAFRLSGDVFYVSYKYDGNGAINTIQVRLETSVDPDAVNEELSKKYTLIDDSSGNYFYDSSDGKIRVTYMPSTNRMSNVIQFKVR